jgi:asparagine synthase (glutamine-hydrolysing)
VCGIAGIVSREPIAEHVLDAMDAALSHRGPDERGRWRGTFAGGHVALVHRRLSIVDLVHGQQPMASGDGSVMLVYNGEIYNAPALRAELARTASAPRTTSDTEVLVELLARDGLAAVEGLRGMFAFAAWDAARSRLLLARDHLGQKPLFFVHRPGLFAFASEVKALLAAGVAGRSADVGTLWHHTGLRFCPEDSSLFAGVRKLRPAERGVYDPGTGALSLERYWTLDYTTKAAWSFGEALDRLSGVLEESVEAHLISDVPTGAFLSGGIDSSTVAAFAARRVGGSFPTFTVGVGDERFSEIAPARLAARTIGTTHHEQRVDPDLFRLLPRIVWHLEEPSDPHAVGIYLLSRVARGHVKVALGGDGGDEAFGGYTRFARSRALDAYTLIPGVIRRAICGPLIRMLPDGRGYYSPRRQAEWAHQMSLVRGAARQMLALTYFRFPEADRRVLFTPQAMSEAGDLDTSRFIAMYHDSGRAESEPDRLMYTEQMTRMAEHDLRVADRMSMAHGLELRAPMMDREVMSFAASLPPSYKIRPGRLKIILRELNRRFYPPEFTDRKKYGFGFPMSAWFAGPLASFVRQVVGQGAFFESGLVRRERAMAIASEHEAGRADRAFQIWNLVNLEVWYRLFVLGESVERVEEWIARRLPASGEIGGGQ